MENLAHTQRQVLHAEGKMRIARAIAEAIPNGCSLILNIGTTTEAVAQALLMAAKVAIVRRRGLACAVPYALEGLLRRELELAGAEIADVTHADEVAFRFKLPESAADALVARLGEAAHGRLRWLEDEG